ncbi:MAG: 2-iminoacetate synthase ThiH [Nitrospinota bacterium]|nr:2-iminoacetate synthase ThiH [Nitrospinota bacterium]
MKKSFYELWTSQVYPGLDLAVELLENANQAHVLAAIGRPPVSFGGFLALISEATGNMEERIQATARSLTEQRFGRTVNMYIPLYLSNACVNDCAYCWFGRSNLAPRKTLALEEVESEAAILREDGYRSILLVSGEGGGKGEVEYLESSIRLVKRLGFVQVGLEARALDVAEYRILANAGLDSVTIYQETYDPDIYARVHPTGPKRDYRGRMEAPQRAAMAGIRAVGMGVLLGLGDYWRDAVALAAHVKHMQKYHWQTSISISFPRIHAAPGGFAAPHPVSDQRFVRLIAAMRLAFPDSILTLSTREAPELRDRLFGMGINQVSAGSKTSPGAYTLEEKSEEQFPVVDGRTPAQVVEAIRGKGLEWVFKDWDVNLRPAPMASGAEDEDNT